MPSLLSQLNYTLQSIFQTRTKTIENNYHGADGDYDDAEVNYDANMLIERIKFYYSITASMPLLRTMKSYLPVYEIAIALEMIKQPSMISNYAKNYDYPWDLFHCTVQLIDIYIQRRPDSEARLTAELRQAIQGISQNFLYDMSRGEIILKNSKGIKSFVRTPCLLMNRDKTITKDIPETEDIIILENDFISYDNSNHRRASLPYETMGRVRAQLARSTIIKGLFSNIEAGDFRLATNDELTLIETVIDRAPISLNLHQIDEQGLFSQEDLTMFLRQYDERGRGFNGSKSGQMLAFISGMSDPNIEIKEEYLSKLLLWILMLYFQNSDNYLLNSDIFKVIIKTLFELTLNKNNVYQQYLICILNNANKFHYSKASLDCNILEFLSIFTETTSLDGLISLIKNEIITIDKNTLPEYSFSRLMDSLDRCINVHLNSGVFSGRNDGYTYGNRNCYSLTILANDAARALSMNSVLHENIPLLMHLFPDDICVALDKFYAIAKRVNLTAAAEQQINFERFVIFQQGIIANHINLMGLDGVTSLRKQISGTLLSLERYCNNLPILPPKMLEALSLYFNTHRVLIKNNPSEDKSWQNILLTLKVLFTMAEKDVVQKLVTFSEYKPVLMFIMPVEQTSDPYHMDLCDEMHLMVRENECFVYGKPDNKEWEYRPLDFSEINNIKQEKEIIIPWDNEVIRVIRFESLQSIKVIYSHIHAKNGHKLLPYDFTPSQYSHILAKNLLETLSQELKDVTEINVELLFQRIPPEKFTQLVKAYKRMENSRYNRVFSCLLTLDFSGGSINHFLHDTDQELGIGRDLARHNQRIRDKLSSKNIEPCSALDYQKTMEFIVLPDAHDALSHANRLVILWSYAEKLKIVVVSELDRHKSSDSQQATLINQLKAVLTSINTLDQLIQKNINNQGSSPLQAVAGILSLEENRLLLDKIKRNLIAIDRMDRLLSPQFNEFSNHFMEHHFQCMRMETNINSIKKHPVPHYFRVEQWSKDKASTFFLGDEVGCCLSTDGAQFSAMVQRRLDDAMLFHVAIDQETGKPAALIWLYLAETVQGTVSLVANFFEVNAKYASNQLRLPLLQSLLSFTHQYCQDNPNIDGFYMNQLGYGWNIGDLKAYPLRTLDINDKLGGPFIPGMDLSEVSDNEKASMKMYTKDMYYLASLYNMDIPFHQFSADILRSTAVQGLYHLSDMITTWVNALMQDGLEKIQTTIAQTHPLELTPFFSHPLEQDLKLTLMIKDAYDQRVIADASAKEQPAKRLKLSASCLPTQGFLGKSSVKYKSSENDVLLGITRLNVNYDSSK